MKLTQEILKELLYYNPETGVFTWLHRDIKWFAHCKYPDMTCNQWNRMYANTTAGYKKKYKSSPVGYIIIKIFCKEYKAHRLAFLYVAGMFPANMVDHIDHNGYNNAFLNLSLSTALKNQKNRPMQKNNISGYTGVSWNKSRSKWQVGINVNKKKIYGGLYFSLSDAIKKRKSMEEKYGFHKNHGR